MSLSVCVSVCPSVRPHITGTAPPDFDKFSPNEIIQSAAVFGAAAVRHAGLVCRRFSEINILHSSIVPPR